MALAQPQQADAIGAAPLMLAGQAHEPADASSGQTQQLLRTTPQHCNGHEQQHRADGEGGLLSSAGEQHDPKNAGQHAAAPDGNGKQPDAARGGAAGREEDAAVDGTDEQQSEPHDEVPRPGVEQPVEEQTEVVDLISDSDDERANIPASQAAAPKACLAIPPRGESFSVLAPSGVAGYAAHHLPSRAGPAVVTYTALHHALLKHTGRSCLVAFYLGVLYS